MDEPAVEFGAEVVGVKVNKTHPDVVCIMLEVPGSFKTQALALAHFGGFYFESVQFRGPKSVDGE